MDVVANSVFQGSGHLPHCVDSLPGGVFGLAIQILYAVLGLLRLAMRIFGSPTQAIFVHSDAPAVWVPTTLALNANTGAQRCGSHYPLSTTHKSGNHPEWKGSRHSLTCTTRSRLGGLPIAPTHATNKKADTKRYEHRCVRTFFDRMADVILSIHRAVADRLGCI